ncbi:hypothetical protein DEU56DRAFT_828422 [Suillus clintonianus]|uniref:uncharacterized protein n=1 Tax=Suillus clintonianus TaxID=1904413 RepID=UPI001B87F32B|nr:uncharacterized protein DEU56DRAFT_828422 [Suillus clintonianus]KAG2124046.1 hypothetical protein DEU56DRAFT_828422 [Suillus clintonianus]
MSTSEPIDLLENSTLFDDNTIVIEIDNLLIGWPTYTIDFTPERPGPVKLILRLKDASKFRWVEDENSEDEAEGTVKPKSHLPQVTEEDPDITLVCEATPKNTQRVSAKPVELHGVRRDSPSIRLTREKFKEEHGYTWPPRRGFRAVSSEVPTTQLDAILTLPAAVCSE